MVKRKKIFQQNSRQAKDLWFVAGELTECTIFMVSVARFFVQEWPRLGLGDKVKVYFSYFKGDFCQMWYRRGEFDAQAEWLTRRMVKNPDWALKIIDQVEDWSKKFFKESAKFKNLPLAKMTKEAIIKGFKKVLRWHDLSHGVGASVSWFAEADQERVTRAIAQMIIEQIKKRGLSLEPATAFSLLSTPEEASFVQKEEKDFLEIARKLAVSRSVVTIFKKTNLNQLARKLKESQPQAFKLVNQHWQKWTWLPYGYRGPAYDLRYFLERWQLIFKGTISPAKISKETLIKERKTKNEQKKLLVRLKFNSYQLKLIKLTQAIVFIKDFRKGALYHGCWAYEPFLKEVGRRLGLTLAEVWAMSPRELEETLLKGKFSRRELKARSKEAVIYIDHKRYLTWTGQQAKSFLKSLPKEEVITEDVKEIIGTCASPGWARGRVKIVEKSGDMVKMNKGDILVSETTYPALVSAMKKASGIVTNAGGLACHAAIVSRELGIPCVVGTKIANKVLKDGDMVEVDATRGIVRKIK